MTPGVRILVLSTVVLGLATFELWSALTPIDTGPLPAATAVEHGATALPGAVRSREARSAADFPHTTSRPAFWRGRQPKAKAAAATQPVAAAPQQPWASPDFRLAGIVQDGGRTRRALLVWGQEPHGRWMEEGAEIDGWRIVTIERFAVHIEASGLRQQIEMK